MAGLGLIGVTYAFVPSLNGNVALGVIGTALIIGFGDQGLCQRLLSQPFMIHIGKLWHSL